MIDILKGADLKMIEIVSGRAGCGKTTYCLNIVAEVIKNEPEREVVLIVPDTETFDVEYKLLKLTGGFFNVQVSGFKRYFYRVLNEQGKINKQYLSDTGKILLLTLMIEEKKTALKALATAAGKKGFAEVLLRLFEELLNSNIKKEDLLTVLNKIEGQSKKDQLLDLAMLYGAWQEKLASFKAEESDYAKILVPYLKKSAFCHDAVIVIDGFQWFSKQEWCVIEQWLSSAFCVIFSLTNVQDESLTLSESKKTIQKILSLAEQNNLQIKQTYLQTNYRFRNTDLQKLEQVACFDGFLFSEKLNKNNGFVEIYKALDFNNEVNFIVSEIKRLCQEEDCLFKELAIIVLDDDYGSALEQSLQREGILAYFDLEKTLADHALAEMLQALLCLLTSKKWDYASVFRFLKSGLLNITERECDLLENYVLAHGIKGQKQWLKETAWSIDDKEDLNKEIDAVRKKAFCEFKELLNGFKKAMTVKSFCVLLYDFLLKTEIPTKLENLTITLEKKGNLQEAEEHRYLWQYVMDFFDEIVLVAGDVSISLQDKKNFENLKNIMLTALRAVSLKKVQPCFDYVAIMPANKAKGLEKKIVFVCSALEGLLPAGISTQSFFSSKEKSALEKAGLALQDNTALAYQNALYTAYSIVTRAREKCIFTYPQKLKDGTEGKAANWLMLLVKEGVCLKETKNHFLDKGFIYQELLKKIHTEEVNFLDKATLKECNHFAKIKENWFKKASVNPDLLMLKQNFQGKMTASVSRLQTYFACPFKFFGNYILSLKERKIKGLSMLDIGNILHLALEKFLKEEKNTKTVLKEGEAQIIATKLIDALMPCLEKKTATDEASLEQQKVLKERMARRLAKILCHFTALRAVLKSQQTETEKEFNYQLEENSQEAIQVGGKIDCIDAWEKDGKLYQLAIDYKTNKAEFNLEDIYYGLGLQLVVYLLALRYEKTLQNQAWLPMGLLYYAVKPALIDDESGLKEEALKTEQWQKMKLKGILSQISLKEGFFKESLAEFVENITIDKESALVNVEKSQKTLWTQEEIEKLFQFVEEKIKQGFLKIKKGEMIKKPFKKAEKTACAYCSYGALCLFEEENDSYHHLGKVDKAKLLGEENLANGSEQGEEGGSLGE